MEKSYLFLQGPHGPFFKELGKRLRKTGARVLRVNFNGGDWIDWHGVHTVDFTGLQSDWSAFVADLLQQHQITDLMVYGDCRSLHRIAIGQAKANGLRVHVFEEGYIRPNWITLEEGGVNGNSLICKDILLDQLQLADAVEESSSKQVGPSMRWTVFYCLLHFLFKAIFLVRFRNYITHRPYRPYQELFLWVGNLLHMPLLQARTKKRTHALRESGKPYYLVCLQLDSDAQLSVHSECLSVAGFINRVLRSFAKDAPTDSLLVFKKHPLDSGAIAYETLARIEAYSLGVRERILFLHTGNLPELIQGSRGVVIANSTVGTSALHHQKPVITLGKAIYDFPGLTWQGGLQRFWAEAVSPDPILYQQFRSRLMKEVLVNGGFSKPRGRRLALKGVMQRLQASENNMTSIVKSGHGDGRANS